MCLECVSLHHRGTIIPYPVHVPSFSRPGLLRRADRRKPPRQSRKMATLGEAEGEPLDGESGAYRSDDGEGDEYEVSTTDGNEEPVPAAPFPENELRQSLGFLRATRRLALPGVGFDEGGDDGSVVALAAVDLFGLLLVSSATGVCILKRGVHRRTGSRRKAGLNLSAVCIASPEHSLAQVALQPWTTMEDCYRCCISH